ncbi:hypothetical protein ARAM_006611 [Aspergillus rambellii]|uniref:Uncharacterized protein n=1 Tax=Aspergillus rambellii TaxID=308745 RepID=A0A0F8VUA0_9EURO|nr:hypothetical protein ARAM_006611 [Aspergillus rambellii]
MSGANGATLHSISPDGTHSTHAWKVLSRLLPSRDLDTDIWWQLTGRQLAVLLDAAAYPIERQLPI